MSARRDWDRNWPHEHHQSLFGFDLQRLVQQGKAQVELVLTSGGTRAIWAIEPLVLVSGGDRRRPLAGVWFFPPGTSAKHVPDFTGGRSMQATDQAVAPSPTLIMLRKMLPDLARRAHPDDRAAMTAFYERTAGSLLWVTESGISERGRAVINEVRKADDWGLRASDFALPQLPAGTNSPRLRPKPRSS